MLCDARGSSRRRSCHLTGLFHHQQCHRITNIPNLLQKCLLIFINGKLYQHHFNVPIAPVIISINTISPFELFSCSNLVRSPSKEGTKAQKRLLISKLPQVLHIVLRRFRSLPQTTLRRPTSRQARQLSHKITLHVNFDEYLDMAPYCTQPTNNSVLSTRAKQYETTLNDCLYRLRGVIVHYGKSINTGHFVAFVYNDILGKGDEQWRRRKR